MQAGKWAVIGGQVKTSLKISVSLMRQTQDVRKVASRAVANVKAACFSELSLFIGQNLSRVKHSQGFYRGASYLQRCLLLNNPIISLSHTGCPQRLSAHLPRTLVKLVSLIRCRCPLTTIFYLVKRHNLSYNDQYVKIDSALLD